MVEVFVLPDSDAARVRMEAARIFKLRREISRKNALRELDCQMVKEAAAAGMRRGEAFTRADAFLEAINARLTELERQAGQCTIVRNIVPISRKGAAA